MIGTVDKRFLSKSGNPMLSIDGKPYVCKDVDVSRIQLGDNIEFEGHSFGDGKIWALDSYKLVSAAAKYAAPKANGGQGGITEGERLFISNVVGQAVAAGTIKDPEQIEKWVSAAKNALRSQGE